MQENGWTTVRISYKDAQALVYGSSEEDVEITPDDVIYIWYTRILGIKIYDLRAEPLHENSRVKDRFYIEDEEGSHVVVLYFGKNHIVAAMKDKQLYEQSNTNATW